MLLAAHYGHIPVVHYLFKLVVEKAMGGRKEFEVIV